MLGERLRRAREKKKLTQEHIAKYLGITRPAYTQYESGLRKPDPDTLAKLATLFDVSVDWLITGDDAAHDISTEEREFLRWVDEHVGDVFFHDFAESTDEQRKSFLETMRILWEIERRKQDKQ
ncbi:MAG: helix-turn-helix transcriptional regulator [Alicyclobacillus sp.]|nr:helix-turn-helix transcriptional regulator [Alicyclobacillus sp.]